MNTQIRSGAPSQRLTENLLRWLRDRRGPVVLATLMLGLGLALNGSWLAAAGVAPLLLSALPCVAMCVLGLCMKRMTAAPDKTASPDLANTGPETDGAGDAIERPSSCCLNRQSSATTTPRR
jgi:hypothetical protein